MIRPARGIYGALVVGLAVFVLQSFVPAILAACIAAVASWPLYARFRAWLPPGRVRRAAPLMFTAAMGAFVLAPMAFAFVALAGEAHELIAEVADADNKGISIGQWVREVPVAGPWVSDLWTGRLDRPGALLGWTHRSEPGAVLGLAQSLGQFMAHHLFIILFTILLLYFLYQEGEVLSRGLKRCLRRWIGSHARAYTDLCTQAIRASVNGILLVAFFDGLATGIVYVLLGAPHAAVWGAITGALALVPFVGYAAVAALGLRMAMHGAGAAAALLLALGAAVLFFGDKVVRPAVTRNGTHLGFVWVLMGCFGGFETLGLVGLVIGPVALSLLREMWEQQVRSTYRMKHGAGETQRQ